MSSGSGSGTIIDPITSDLGVEDKTVIYNFALGILDEYNITSSDTTSKQYDLCTRFYDHCLRKALLKHKWNEAMQDVIILQEIIAPVFGQAYRYEKPSDALQIRSIGSDLWFWEVKGLYIQTDYARIPTEWATAIAYIAGMYIQKDSVTYLCDVSHTSDVWADESSNWTSQEGDYNVIDVEYIKLLTDTTLMSTGLIDSIAQELAIKVAVAIVGTKGGAKVKEGLLAEYNQIILPNARFVDGVEGRVRSLYQSKWLRARR